RRLHCLSAFTAFTTMPDTLQTIWSNALVSIAFRRSPRSRLQRSRAAHWHWHCVSIAFRRSPRSRLLLCNALKDTIASLPEVGTHFHGRYKIGHYYLLPIRFARWFVEIQDVPDQVATPVILCAGASRPGTHSRICLAFML